MVVSDAWGKGKLWWFLGGLEKSAQMWLTVAVFLLLVVRSFLEPCRLRGSKITCLSRR